MSRAFLVIDIQNDYFPGGALPLWRAEETEARLVAAIGRARAQGDRIVLVRMSRRPRRDCSRKGRPAPPSARRSARRRATRPW